MKTPSRALKQSQQALTERRIPMPKILAELASEGSKSLPTFQRMGKSLHTLLTKIQLLL